MRQLFLLCMTVLLSVFSAIESRAEEATVFKGDVVYGDPKAPVTILEYASFTCSHCGDFAKHTMPKLEEHYIKEGKVKLVIRSYLRNQLDMGISLITHCGTEGQVRKLTKKLLSTQEDWLYSKNLLESLLKITELEGLTKDKVDQCFKDKAVQDALIKQTQVAQNIYKVTGTPTVLVNSVPVENPTLENLEEAIKQALKSK